MNDTTVTLFLHNLTDCLGNLEQAEHIDVEDPLNVCHGHIGHGNLLGDTGIVDQNIDAAKLFHNIRDQSIHRSLVADIAGNTVGFTAQSFNLLSIGSNAFLIDVRQHNGSTLASKGLGDGAPDSLGGTGTGDDNDLSIKIQHIDETSFQKWFLGVGAGCLTTCPTKEGKKEKYKWRRLFL